MFIMFLPTPRAGILHRTETYTGALYLITVAHGQWHDEVLVRVVLPVHGGQRHAQGHVADPVGRRGLGRDLCVLGRGEGGDEGQRREQEGRHL